MLLILLMTSLTTHPSVKGVTKNDTCCLVTKILNLKFKNLQSYFFFAMPLHKVFLRIMFVMTQPHYTPFVKGMANNWLLQAKNSEIWKSSVVCFLCHALAQGVFAYALFHRTPSVKGVANN